jgi:hypothetical protein
LVGVAETWRDEILSSLEILCADISTPAITTPVDPKKNISPFFGDLLLVTKGFSGFITLC